MSGLLLILVAIPFFSFPKSLEREREQIRLAQKAQPAVAGPGTIKQADHTAKQPNEGDSGYGKDIKGGFIQRLVTFTRSL